MGAGGEDVTCEPVMVGTLANYKQVNLTSNCKVLRGFVRLSVSEKQVISENNPIGRGNGLKIRKVWVRIPLLTCSLNPTGRGNRLKICKVRVRISERAVVGSAVAE